MPFRRVKLRGQDVWARCREDGSLAGNGGRVEIRYKAGDGKAYFAAERNLTLLDAAVRGDEEFGDASPVQKSADARAKKAEPSIESYPTAPEGEESLAYADGACKGNPGPAGLGVVLMDAEGRHELSEYLGDATNNIAELTAILRAVERSVPGRPLRIFTDSTYSIGVLQKNWKAKANVELVAAVRAAMKRHGQVMLFHVRGHAGIPLNERVDELAVEAVTTRRTAGWR
jgi:ribonuclease HI